MNRIWYWIACKIRDAYFRKLIETGDPNKKADYFEGYDYWSNMAFDLGKELADAP